MPRTSLKTLAALLLSSSGAFATEPGSTPFAVLPEAPTARAVAAPEPLPAVPPAALPDAAPPVALPPVAVPDAPLPAPLAPNYQPAAPMPPMPGVPAQPVLTAPGPRPDPVATVPAPGPAPACPELPALVAQHLPERGWVTGEYLMWWVRNGNLPFPVATTSPTASLGILDLANTRVVRGNEKFDYGAFSGGRLAAGRWLGDGTALGLEASGFLLGQHSDRFSVASGRLGAPLLARPFLDTTTGRGNSRLLALPGGAAGRLDVSSASQLWGAELSALHRVTASEHLTLDALAGFRYLDLEENLRFNDRSDLFSPLATTAFNGRGVLAPATTAVSDSFVAHNQFYGGQVGARASYTRGIVTLDVTGKVALGSVHQTLYRNGTTTLFNGPAPVTVPGGFYVQSSNFGRFTDDQFAVLPEVALRVRVKVTDSVSLTAGYTYLFLSPVIRPGDQVDRTLNPTLIPTSPTFGQPFGPARPAPLFTRGSFDAHGVSLGLDVRY